MADDYGYEQGEFEQKPKVVKDFAKAYMQVRILIIFGAGYRPVLRRWWKTWPARQPKETKKASCWLQKRR